MPNPKYKRVLLKLSGETLLSKDGRAPIDQNSLKNLAQELLQISKLNVGLGLVIGGGNICRGAALEGNKEEREQFDTMGMLATVINSIAIKVELERLGIDPFLCSAIPMGDLVEPIDREKANSAIEKGKIVIFGGGTGKPFFSTDTAAAMRALEIDAEVVLKATKVDGVYDSDPMKNKAAKRFSSLTYDEAISRDLKVMDQAAFTICRDKGLPIIVFNFFEKGNVARVICGEVVGTIIN